MTQELSVIDHLVYAVPELESGRDAVEKLLGVRPVLGGSHPDFGTHNALLSFGPSTYLEVIAPDPELPRPKRGLIFQMDELQKARLATWALRTEQIKEALAKGKDAGLDLGSVFPGSRKKKDGTLLEWQLTDPWLMPFEGAIPFLISWGKTPHPARSLPKAGRLIGLSIEHPQAEIVRAALKGLGLEIEVHFAQTLRLVAQISVDSRLVEIS